MKILKGSYEELVRRPNGSLSLMPWTDDDLWCVSNIILPGDLVTAPTVRKVSSVSASGNKDVRRVHLTLQIKVKSVDYDKDASLLRLQGNNLSEKQWMNLGQAHTLELGIHTQFELHKSAWDSAALHALREACDPTPGANLAVLLMHEGLAHLHLIRRSITTHCFSVSASIPRKHVGSSGVCTDYQSALRNFFRDVTRCTLNSVNFDVVRYLVIASPGFTKDQFCDHLLAEAERQELQSVLENRSRIVLTHADSGYRHSLPDVLAQPGIMRLIKDTKPAGEVRALNDFLTMMYKNPDRACYGPRHVQVAQERTAIQSLLITDALFGSSDVQVRKHHIQLVNAVEKDGGSVSVFSSMHSSGEKLAQFTGIAAILRFPLPELDDIDM